ncbi:PASTA domain-containing protein [Curtobacterium sp. MCPF17_052]|uniref:PASTA domain-containing protein n=1 Tax=Curtobacterium sp. MCPF17_052 TaxID=2175655 RepID=UPI003464C143
MAYFVANLEPGKPPVSSSIKVPSVSGQTFDEAQATLERRGLKAVRDDEPSDDVDEDDVIRTVPGSGTSVARDQDIRIVVSTGPEQIAVPDVQSQTQDAATKALESAGFSVGAVSSDYSPTVPEGTVLSSDPASGGTQAKGSVVNLVVSNGKVQLPDVTQQPFDTARSTLAGLGLTVQPAPTYACTGTTVTQQSVPASDVAQGSSVTLTYCAGTAQPQRQPSRQPAAPSDPGADNGGTTGGGATLNQGDDG